MLTVLNVVLDHVPMSFLTRRTANFAGAGSTFRVDSPELNYDSPELRIVLSMKFHVNISHQGNLIIKKIFNHSRGMRLTKISKTRPFWCISESQISKFSSTMVKVFN